MRMGKLSHKEIKELVKETYVFFYPLIMHYYTMYKHALNPGSPEFAGGFGKFLHFGLIKPGDVDIVAPNNDTPYSLSWVDARSEPWVLVMPPVEPDRYCSAQIDDLWAFVVDNAGSITDGNDGGAYLLTTRSWRGETPKGIKRVIRGDSSFLYANIRTQVFNEAEFARVREIQNSFRVLPLHEFLGTPAPRPAPALQWPPIMHGDEKRSGVFKYVGFLLSFTEDHPLDREHMEKAAQLGIERGKEWKLEDFSAAQQQAIREGVDEAYAFLVETAKYPSVPGERFGNREKMGKRFLHRAHGVYAGLGGNTVDQAVYLRLAKDEKGEFLDASRHSYKITFPGDNLPRAKYFWSLTMYAMPSRFLAPNPLDRYSIGSRAVDALHRNPDGGFDIYFGKDSPGKEKENNWLPAPDGNFIFLLRIFGPDEAAMSGKYTAPPITIVS